MTILRRGAGAQEVWLRCDAGPHGFLSIAAHGHADALSVELRQGGVELLADPGTYCYHGEPQWRALFRGTAGHNTLTVRDCDQAVSGGPFLWLTRPRSTLVSHSPVWQARHDGYHRLPGKVTHCRRVVLRPGSVHIFDTIAASAAQPVLLAFHLGPAVTAQLCGQVVELAWPGGSGRAALPGALQWELHRGQIDPPLGWYSAGFGQRQPATLLAGRGCLQPGAELETIFSLPEP